MTDYKKVEIPPQYITVREIMEVSGASRAKIQIVLKFDKWGFPAKAGRIAKWIVFWRDEVLAWLKRNPLAQMTLSQVETRKQRNQGYTWPNNRAFDHEKAAMFMAGRFDCWEKKKVYRVLKLNASGTTTRVALYERHIQDQSHNIDTHRGGNDHHLTIGGYVAGGWY